ncbi:MAG TPA: glutathione S-transferase family protein [Steroidobacteraceae bacterium]|nr:glutathione S-transferase family protein [Steroidobacteraceae bacterium]
MRLYYHPFSTNARRAVMTTIELNVPVELVLVDLQKREQQQPAFLAKNPAGRVPVLEDGAVILPESHAIMLYLATSSKGQTLYPSDVQAQAQVNRWMFWCAAHFQPAISVLNWENFVKKVAGLGVPDPAEILRGERLVKETAALLDAHLASREWVAGSTMTLADISLATPLMTAKAAKLPVAQFRHLQDWFARIEGRESWQRTNPPATSVAPS